MVNDRLARMSEAKADRPKSHSLRGETTARRLAIRGVYGKGEEGVSGEGGAAGVED
jgi:hypothetical protein